MRLFVSSISCSLSKNTFESAIDLEDRAIITDGREGEAL